MATQWFIARHKQRFGPFSAGQLKQLAALGLLQPGEHLWAQGTPKWVMAQSVEEIFPAPVQTKYWLALGGKPAGPYPPEYTHN